MRPIKLKIKGINSFMEEQVIDFEKLTQKGFFGIFGPTGSGKSTILDGITLALYGKVARDSKNFVNTNCKTGSVSFEFQISGKEVKRYLVERSFKKDKEKDTARADKCRVMDITSGGTEVLGDMKTTVDKICEDIIGLNLDDFTRTVVLPQGKFSEFLKLKGEDRRKMLERLFNLEMYGENLFGKVKNEYNNEKTKYSELQGELKGYEDVSEEARNEKKKEVDQSGETLEKINKDLEAVKKAYSEGEEIWNLQLEKQEETRKYQELKSREEEMDKVKKSLKLAEAADRVRPYMEEYKATTASLNTSKESLERLKKDLGILTEEKDRRKKEYEDIKVKRDEEIPRLRVKYQEVREALKEKQVLDGMDKNIYQLKSRIVQVKDFQEKRTLRINELTLREEKSREKISGLEEELEKSRIDTGLKEKVQRGVSLTEKIEGLTKVYRDLSAKVEKGTKDIERAKAEEKAFSGQMKGLKDEEEKQQSELKNLQSNKPGDASDLISLQQRISEVKIKWNQYEGLSKDFKSAEEKLKAAAEKADMYKAQRKDSEAKVKELKEKLKIQETENLAHRLREQLRDGDICPVCGSVHHHPEAIKEVVPVDVSDLEHQVEGEENHLKLIERYESEAIAAGDFAKDTMEKVKQKIEAMGSEFLSTSPEALENQFITMKSAFEKYEEEKKNLEEGLEKLKDNMSKLQQEVVKAETFIVQREKQLESDNKELKENEVQLKEQKADFEKLAVELKVEDFVKKNREILSLERHYAELENSIKAVRKELETLTADKAVMEAEFNKGKEALATDEASLLHEQRTREERLENIKAKVRDINHIAEELEEVKIKGQTLEGSYKNAEELKNKAEEKFTECSSQVSELGGRVNSLEEKFRKCQENLKAAMDRENFKSSEELKESLLERELQQNMKERIEKYNNDISKVLGAMDTINRKLGVRSLEEEKWLQLKENKSLKQQEADEVREADIKLRQELEILERKLKELGDLGKKKQKIEHRMDLLSQLFKLFSGKKFVEFVAIERLKYISIEASKELKDISCGNYGLEVDENGMFFIRDYKNGGARRDASTLSGGETFIASLALALALSSEVQLKGTAPLELFFLDEGFGTLDNNLLDIVMGSLEKIHNDKLKIGLISHVDAIKERVPVRIIVSPAEAGLGGSKTKIEIN